MKYKVSNCCGATVHQEMGDFMECSNCKEPCDYEILEENAELKDVLKRILMSLSYLSRAVEIGNIDLQAYRNDIETIYQEIEKI